MSRWLVLLAFEDERAAQEFTKSVILTGGVEVAIGGTWQSEYVTVELGPYLEEGQS